MKIVNKRVIQTLACGICTLAAAPVTLAAEAQPGGYIGVSVGKSSFDIEKDLFDDIVIDAFFASGAQVLSGSSTFEDSDTSMAIVAGYRFSPYIALEASYLDLGTAEYRSTGTVNPPGPITSAPASVNADVETKGFTVGGIGGLPLGQVVDLHGRLGIFIAQTELSVAATIGSSTGTESESGDSTTAFYGVGAGFQLGEHWSLSLDWTRYADVGEGDDEDEEGGFDIDALSVGLAYRF